jgi:glycosyltransferase involved in cell wall biosynthesis
MPGVKYIGPVFDGSGYAEAARNYVLSIYRKGYPITLAPISFEQSRPDLGKDGEILQSLVNRQLDYDKIIVHSTPDLWERWVRFERNKHIIGYTVWETSKIHPTWTMSCNRVDEVWLPCEWNMNVFKDSGVTVPLYKIPHAIDVPDLDKVPDFNIDGIGPDDYVFYSIFQWQERKNPHGLLSAYNAAFTGIDDVVLVLKTYIHDHADDRGAVIELIKNYRNCINLDHYPKIYLIVENMSRENIMGLHKRCDCFSLFQRSEGWGLPHFEAAAMGNPVITPSYGGQSDFLNVDNSYPVDYNLTPVDGMRWSPYYKGDQLWCEPNLEQAMSQMLHVYNNRDTARAKGLQARADIQKNFTWDKIGDTVVNRLIRIDQGGSCA